MLNTKAPASVKPQAMGSVQLSTAKPEPRQLIEHQVLADSSAHGASAYQDVLAERLVNSTFDVSASDVCSTLD